MSEFEIASLDYQTATLAARHWANWIAGLALAVSAAVGAAQCAIVAWGIREMVRANRERARQTDEQARAAERRAEAQTHAAERRAEAQTRAADQRHAENMAALAEQSRRLDTLIEGQADQRQALNAAVASLNAQTDRLNAQTDRLDALVEGQAEQRRASAAQTRALLELIERAAPNAPPA